VGTEMITKAAKRRDCLYLFSEIIWWLSWGRETSP